MKFTLPVNSKILDPKQTILYIFNVGHSGNSLEKLKSGKLSNAYVIWQRSISQENENGEIENGNYGFADFAINKDTIDVKFYEMKAKDEVVKTAFFTIVETIMPDQNVINSILDEKFCKGDRR